MAEETKVLGLHNLPAPRGATTEPKRKGRGPGSGLGQTAGPLFLLPVRTQRRFCFLCFLAIFRFTGVFVHPMSGQMQNTIIIPIKALPLQ